MATSRTRDNARRAEIEARYPDCMQCGAPFYRTSSGIGTGYGWAPDMSRRICYACCGDNDRAQMIRDGKTHLYLSSDRQGRTVVSNWPGSLTFRPRYVTSCQHPWARSAGRIAYFTGPDGKPWSARNGSANHDIAFCKRIARFP